MGSSIPPTPMPTRQSPVPNPTMTTVVVVATNLHVTAFAKCRLREIIESPSFSVLTFAHDPWAPIVRKEQRHYARPYCVELVCSAEGTAPSVAIGSLYVQTFPLDNVGHSPRHEVSVWPALADAPPNLGRRDVDGRNLRGSPCYVEWRDDFTDFDPATGPGEQDVESRLEAMELAMLQATEALERDQQGLATPNALLALVNGLGALPGRKAVVFFSYGLMLPGRDLDALRTIVSEANRKGVSFYAADGAGRKADMARRATAPGLGKLARDTGGALISGTGEFSAGLRRVEEDLGTHYVLSYTPKSAAWDGGYRRVELEVHRDGLDVQGRRGYFAVRTPVPTPILEHEAPVLAALEQAPGATEIPLRVSALQFPDAGGDTTVAIVADLPIGSPSLRVAEGDESTWTQDFTVLALVRNEEAQIVHKSSRRYVLSWGEESLDA